ncbi:right-handed parallel beta-helix repeat-containing protein [Candidatus Binatia bacterium]|nr:right-handed parallel beta-helix repeat-containing protein [Candidatus Binatia bacterium]
MAAAAIWVARADAYPSYDDGVGNGCVQCHTGFQGGPSVGTLHLRHQNDFGITSCTLCHQLFGGDTPVLTYYSAQGYGCSGCHAQDYGHTSLLSGQPKATGYGLRLYHASEGVTACVTCHFPGSGVTGEPDPAPAVLPETSLPPYYGLANNNLTDPCSSTQEDMSYDADAVGLDNDGNGLVDGLDPACAAPPVDTPTPTPTSSAPTPTPTGTSTPAMSGKRLIKVFPGSSIQAAVDAAAPGTTIVVMPGLYEETHGGQNAVSVRKDGIRLIGRKYGHDRVVLKAVPGQKNGVVVEPSAPGGRIDGFTIRGFVIRDFPKNGIVTRYVDNFRIQGNESIDNKENGIWPTLSAKGLVSRNVSYGSDDSAMWVETSVNVRVVNNVLHTSVTGLEVSNSDDILLRGNEAYNNTVGIGLYMQPGLERKQSNRWHVTRNHVYDNNRANTAPPSSMAGALPTGGGVLLLGPDSNLVENNLIENNGFYGVAVVDYCLVVDGTAFNCVDNVPDFDPSPDNNRIKSNRFVNNGTSPPIGHPFAFLANDAIAFGGSGNCFEDNILSTSFPNPLPGC